MSFPVGGLERTLAEDGRWFDPIAAIPTTTRSCLNPIGPVAGRRRVPARRAVLSGVAVGRLGRREEALEIAQPVPAVTPRVDPVIAEAALVAPRPDGVRMDAEQPGGLRHGEGRVGGVGL